MSNEPTAAIHFVMPMFHFLSGKGISMERLFREARIDIAKLKSPDSRVSIDDLNRISDASIKITGDSSLGFSIGSTYLISYLGIVGHLMMNCSTIGEAWEKYCKFQELPGDIVHIHLTEGKTLSRFHWDANPGIVSNLTFILELVIAAVLAATKELSGQNLTLREARFNYAKPYNISDYKKFFNCDLHFNEEETAIVFESRYLDLPVKNPDNQLLKIMENHAIDYLHNHRKGHSVASQVEKALKVYNGIIPEINLIANALEMPIRNLQYKLSNEGTNFSAIREKVRCELALEYIRNKKYSANEISNMLGFSDPSVFRRTFKRWAGMTPGQYKKMIHGDTDHF